ncbi:DUF4296 domain-containing protein [Lutibacter sp.]
MTRFFYIFFLGAVLTACTSNTIIKKPKNLIPKNQMVDLITDLLLASGAQNVKNINIERKVNYFPLVFKKYHIDTTRFKESNFYYTSRIDDYDDILREVDQRLKLLKQQTEEMIRKQDSSKRKLKNPFVKKGKRTRGERKPKN